MSLDSKSLIHAISAAVAIIFGASLLQRPALLPPTPPPSPPIWNPKFIEDLVAYDFNSDLKSELELHSLTNAVIKQTSVNPFTVPFFLASIELATLGLTYCLTVFFPKFKQPSCADDSPGFTFATPILLLSPLLVLSAVAQYAAWSPAVQIVPSEHVPTAMVALFLLLRAFTLPILAKLSTPLKHIFSVPSTSSMASTVFCLISVFALNSLALVSTCGDLPLLAVLLLSVIAPLGPWVSSVAASAMGAQPRMIACQFMLAALFALFMSFMTKSVASVDVSGRSLFVFAAASCLSATSRISLPAISPLIPVDLFRDQLSFIFSFTNGFTDTSSIVVQLIYILVVAVTTLSPRFGLTDATMESVYSLLQAISTNRTTSTKFDLLDCESSISTAETKQGPSIVSKKNLYSVLFRAAISATTVFSLFLVIKSSFRGTAPANRPTANSSSPSMAQKVHTELGASPYPWPLHQHVAIPPGKSFKQTMTVTFMEDKNDESPVFAKTKEAHPFAISATVDKSVNNTFNACFPSLENVPKRKWDALKPNQVPKHAQNMTWNHIQIAISSNPGALDRIAFTAQTWAREERIQWTAFWGGEDDSNGMVGDHSFLLDTFKRVTGKYPVVMRGDPGRAWSRNIKWFKMLPYLYQRSSESTRWFFVCDDDTLIFPDVLMDNLRSIPDDPLTTSLYIGDISESNRQANQWGRDMAFGGGGALISRHLAQRLYAKFQWCLDVVKDHEGDGFLRSCVLRVTRMDGGEPVSLTRIPIFNQVDLMEWSDSGREFLSAKLSRAAPATLHHPAMVPILMAGMNNKKLALFDFWHITNKIPQRLRFRRFFIHLENGGTVVVTFGLHVRVYLQRLYSVEYSVDWDSNITHDPNFTGIEFLMERAEKGGPEPPRRKDYVDYWLLHHEKDRMVFSNDEYDQQFVLACSGSNENILAMCSPTKGEDKE